MLHSESKERGNRFAIALKIAFPSLFLVIILAYTFQISINNFKNELLLVILIPIYIYYIFYLIYGGFKTTLIDPITKTFTRKEIIKIVKNSKKKHKDSTIVLLKIDNIVDINERYGITNADNLLRIFCQKLDSFFSNYNFKNIPIGRYGGGYFLLIIKSGKKELKHLLTIFSKELKNIGINDIEIKIDFALLEAEYDDNIKNIIEKLMSLVEAKKQNDEITPNIKPNELEKIIYDGINEEKFILKYQPSLEVLYEKISIYEVLTKIYSKDYGMLSRAQIERAVNHIGYETIFDKKIVANLVKELETKDFKDILFSIKVSPVSLRNNDFIQFISQLFYKSTLRAENFILEFSEFKACEEIHRFREILSQYKKLGFKIALDNFGGDNCSLEYIKTLPIDIVKFDIEFTKNIDDSKYQEILRGYITFLKKLDIKVMIKFIDKIETKEKILTFDPDFIQGFIISKPINLQQIKNLGVRL